MSTTTQDNKVEFSDTGIIVPFDVFDKILFAVATTLGVRTPTPLCLPKG
jgi:hypothetical protein